jgi:hypothetical protein
VLRVCLFTGLLSKADIQFDPPGITFGYLSGKVAAKERLLNGAVLSIDEVSAQAPAFR